MTGTPEDWGEEETDDFDPDIDEDWEQYDNDWDDMEDDEDSEMKLQW